METFYMRDAAPWCRAQRSVEDPFDCTPALPRQVKAVLKTCFSNSKPGANGISYYHLKNLRTLHPSTSSLTVLKNPIAQQCSPSILVHGEDCPYP